MFNRSTPLILGFCLLMPLQALAADVAVIGDSIDRAPVGSVPAGWHAAHGKWSIKADLDDLRAPPEHVLSCIAGQAWFDDADFDDFVFTTKIRFHADRGEWNTRLLFRLQDESHYYAVAVYRTGWVGLELASGKEQPQRLATSAGPFPVAEGDWYWLRVRAEGNHIQIEGSSEGIRYATLIDYDDPQSTFAGGKIGFVAGGDADFSMSVDPASASADREAKGAWIEAIRPTGEFQKNVDGPVLCPTRVDVDALDIQKVPLQMTAAVGDRTLLADVGELDGGQRALHLLIPIADGTPMQSVTFRLLRGKDVIDQAKFDLTNPMSAQLFKPSSPAPPPAIDLDRPVKRADYLAHLEQIDALIAAKKGEVAWEECRPLQAVTLFKATGETKYLDQVVDDVHGWIRDRQSGLHRIPGDSFVMRYPCAMAITLAIEQNKLTPDEKIAALDILGDVQLRASWEGGGLENRAMGMTLGIEPTLRLIPDYLLAPELNKYAATMEHEIVNQGEPLENAANYIPITLLYLDYWIESNGRQDLYDSPKLKHTFERLLDMLSPAAGLPWFGDYGGTQSESTLLIAVLEKAASVYHDGRYKWAAHRMYQAWLQDPASQVPVVKFSGWELMALASAYAWADDSVPEVKPTIRSVVDSRNSGQLDKAILRTGWDRDDLYVMTDLMNGYEHGDNDPLAITSICKNGLYALSDKSGRDQSNHSAPLVRPSPEDFPFPREDVPAGKWCHASLELKNHWSFNNFFGGVGSPMLYSGVYGMEQDDKFPSEYTYDPARQFTFVLTLQGKGRARLCLDDIKLVGKKGEKMLEDFEGQPQGWVGRFAQADDARFGNHCGAFELDLLNGQTRVGKKFAYPLDIDSGDYDRIEFWYKITPEDGQASFYTLTIGDKQGYPCNYLFIHSPMAPSECLACSDGSAAANVTLRVVDTDPSGGRESRTRQILLAGKKLLWVRDQIADQAPHGATAGPLWYARGLSPIHGANWFDTWDEGNLLVYFLPHDQRTQGFGDTHRVSLHDFRVPFFVYQTQTPAAPFDLAFDTLLIPHDSTVDPAVLAKSIRVLHDDQDFTLVSVGDDLLLRNPSGRIVKQEGIETDCKTVCLSRSGEKLLAADGQGGTTLKYQSTVLPITPTTQPIE
jgi:hypothetical protein